MIGTRKPVNRRRKPRRGGEDDRDYLAWIASQPCMVSGRPSTVHHVRRFGEPRQDRRTVPLAPEYHQIGCGSDTAVESIGKDEFERRFGVDLEKAILKYNALYDAIKGKQDSGGWRLDNIRPA